MLHASLPSLVRALSNPPPPPTPPTLATSPLPWTLAPLAPCSLRLCSLPSTTCPAALPTLAPLALPAPMAPVLAAHHPPTTAATTGPRHPTHAPAPTVSLPSLLRRRHTWMQLMVATSARRSALTTWPATAPTIPTAAAAAPTPLAHATLLLSD